eukprot:6184836-Pleurochrysis_carterae.AAC.2
MALDGKSGLLHCSRRARLHNASTPPPPSRVEHEGQVAEALFVTLSVQVSNNIATEAHGCRVTVHCTVYRTALRRHRTAREARGAPTAARGAHASKSRRAWHPYEMTHVGHLRLKKELNMMYREPPPGISAWANEEDSSELEAVIEGADDTPYAKGRFRLKINIPPRYPFEPPKVGKEIYKDCLALKARLSTVPLSQM